MKALGKKAPQSSSSQRSLMVKIIRHVCVGDLGHSDRKRLAQCVSLSVCCLQLACSLEKTSVHVLKPTSNASESWSLLRT